MIIKVRGYEMRVGMAAAIGIGCMVMVQGCSREEAAPAEVPSNVAAPVESVSADPLSGSTLTVVAEKVAGGTPNAKRCNVERLGGQPLQGSTVSASRSADLVFTGWVVDEVAGKVPEGVRFRLQSVDGRIAAEQSVGDWRERADVAKHFGQQAYAQSGFSVTVKAPGLPAGRYGAYVTYQTSAGPAYCGLGTQFQLAE